MKFKKILLIPWLLCLPIAAGIQNIDKESNFENNNTEVLADKEETYLNLDITYGKDTYHEGKPAITSIDVYYNNLIDIEQIAITGETINTQLNKNNPDPKLTVGDNIDFNTNKGDEELWKDYFISFNWYQYDSKGKDTFVGKNKETGEYDKYINGKGSEHKGYPMMFYTNYNLDEITENNYLKLYAVSPAEDLWYAPTTEIITIDNTKEPNENIGNAKFVNVDAREGMSIFWWIVIGLFIVGITSFIGWKIYKKKNKYLI